MPIEQNTQSGLIAGAVLGLIYFATLWATVWLLPRLRYPGLVMLVSYLGRILLAGAVFAVASMRGGWKGMLATVAGFLAIRLVVLLIASQKRVALS